MQSSFLQNGLNATRKQPDNFMEEKSATDY